MHHQFDKFRRFFSESRFFNKLGNYAQTAGLKVVYSSLLLYYAYQRKETPSWAKRIIMGTLGYLVMPFDFLPDLSPIIGYTDDLGVLSFGLVTIAAFVNEEVKQKARQRLEKWFPSADEHLLNEVDEKL
ncbi:MAG: YkvA family protein [Bacteroidota bacterium]